MLSSLRSRVLVGVMIPLVVSAATAWWANHTTRLLYATIVDLQIMQTVDTSIDEIDGALAALEQIFLARAGYVHGPPPPTPDVALHHYDQAISEIRQVGADARIAPITEVAYATLDRLAARGITDFSAGEAVVAAGAMARALQLALAIRRAADDEVMRLGGQFAEPLAENRLAHQIAVGLAAGLLLVGLFAAAAITRPLDAAKSAAETFAAGDFSARVAEAGPVEVRVFASAMNRMGEAIEHRDRRLEGALADAARHRDLLHSLVDGADTGLLLYDASGRMVAVNQRCAGLIGFTVAQVLESDHGVLQAEVQARLADPEHYREALARHFAQPGEPHQDQIILTKPTRRVIRRCSCPVFDAGAPAGRVFTYTDVTAEADLNRMKSEFVSMTSHELRTPLTSVHGALQLALAGAGNRIAAEDRELLEISLLSTERLVRLVNDLLDLSKLDAGRMPMTITTIRLPELLAETAAAMRGFAATRQMTVDVECAADAPAIEADRDQVSRVLANLLSNAVKYSPEGGRITLSAAAAGEAVEIAVADEGAPIPPDQVERLFMPFSRVGAQERQTTGGTGLGLALSRAIVTQHEGRIWVEQDERRGKRFVFRLPVVHQAAIADRPAA